VKLGQIPINGYRTCSVLARNMSGNWELAYNYQSRLPELRGLINDDGRISAAAASIAAHSSAALP
jgi:hypothetical protein